MTKDNTSQEKVILVTGCSSGLGFALAQKLYEKADSLVVVTARPESLHLLKARFDESDRFLIRPLDVADTSQALPLINEICCRWGRIDVLINNAGVCFRSVVEHMDPDAEMVQLKTNYLGPMNLVRSLLPILREQGSGHIINVSSASSVVAMPTMASYGASKRALESATEALWYEARPYGIHVSIVQPGSIHSNAFRRVVLSKKAKISAQLGGPHAEYYRSMSPFIEKLMMFSRVDYERIADRILRLSERRSPPLYAIATPDAIALHWLKWLLPTGLFIRLMFRMLPGSRQWGIRKRAA